VGRLVFLYLDDFMLAIHAAVRAYMVSGLVFIAVFAANQVTQAQPIVGAAPVATAAGHFSLR
jgi:hypothetical protein